MPVSNESGYVFSINLKSYNYDPIKLFSRNS